MFTQALLKATYQDGKPGQLTEAHRQAENHRFKTEFLFKEKIISKDHYALRLIQHFLIIKAIEEKLQGLSDNDKDGLHPFFALTYLEHLWRSQPIANDLKQLGVNPDHIQDKKITKQTKAYIHSLEELPPKFLLAHFLLHLAGFMHGGKLITAKYIAPSNRRTRYRISTEQYNFLPARSMLSMQDQSTLALYSDMMAKIDGISLSQNEFESMFKECEKIYEKMVGDL